MLDLETLSAILDEFGGAPVSVQPEHCLNARHKDAGCRLCVAACPTDAIELRSALSPAPGGVAGAGVGQPMGPQQPHLDADRCVNCGLCLHWCPTDVFTQRGAPEPRLARTVGLLHDGIVALVCPQHSTPARTLTPATAIVQHTRCLASLSVPQLLELSDDARRIVWLDDSPCAECPIGRAQPAIVQTAATTNCLLQAFGRQPAIRTHRSHGDELQDEPSPRPVISGDQPELSRRGFFSALGQLTRRTAATVIAESTSTVLSPGRSSPTSSGPVPVDQRLPHRIPASRGRLFRQLKRLGVPVDELVEVADIPFAEVIVDGEACSACRLCARFCPTGALSFVADDESFVLYFKPAICIDCGICAVACPEDAVSFGPRLAAAALIENEPQPLVAGNLAPCTGCGEATAERGGDAGQPDDGPRCYVCRQRTGPTAPLRDSAGLIADLVKRLPEADGGARNQEAERE